MSADRDSARVTRDEPRRASTAWPTLRTPAAATGRATAAIAQRTIIFHSTTAPLGHVSKHRDPAEGEPAQAPGTDQVPARGGCAPRTDHLRGAAPGQPAALRNRRELMEAFGVSRATARNAINALRAEGLIVVLMGKGSFVRREHRPSRAHPPAGRPAPPAWRLRRRRGRAVAARRGRPRHLPHRGERGSGADARRGRIHPALRLRPATRRTRRTADGTPAVPAVPHLPRHPRPHRRPVPHPGRAVRHPRTRRTRAGVDGVRPRPHPPTRCGSPTQPPCSSSAASPATPN